MADIKDTVREHLELLKRSDDLMTEFVARVEAGHTLTVDEARVAIELTKEALAARVLLAAALEEPQALQERLMAEWAASVALCAAMGGEISG